MWANTPYKKVISFKYLELTINGKYRIKFEFKLNLNIFFYFNLKTKIQECKMLKETMEPKKTQEKEFRLLAMRYEKPNELTR